MIPPSAGSLPAGSLPAGSPRGGPPPDDQGPARAAVTAPAQGARLARRAAAGRPSGPLRVRALGRATVEVGGTALTAADWGYAKPRELLSC